MLEANQRHCPPQWINLGPPKKGREVPQGVTPAIHYCRMKCLLRHPPTLRTLRCVMKRRADTISQRSTSFRLQPTNEEGQPVRVKLKRRTRGRKGKDQPTNNRCEQPSVPPWTVARSDADNHRQRDGTLITRRPLLTEQTLSPTKTSNLETAGYL